MSTLTNDIASAPVSRVGAGIGFAVLSATSFGLSGSLGRGLMDAGWSSAAAVAVRILIGAAALLVPALVSLRGRWWLLRRNLPVLTAYGLIAVAGCQLAYFNAVAHMQVGVALLIEYTAPVVVIGWLWLRHGERPSRLTVTGAVIAGAGLLLVLDLISGADVSAVGVVWALAAMVCVAFYWVISSHEDNGLPGVVLAAGGLLVGGLGLLVAGAVNLVPMAASTRQVRFEGFAVPWWVAVLALGVLTAAVSYVAGIAASRRLGSRLASFMGLAEVLAALVFAWLLLGELPRAIQFLGGVLVLAGVIVVKLGEAGTAQVEPADGQATTLSGRPAAG